MTPGSAPDPGHESSDARGAKRVRGLAPPLRPTAEGGLELDVIFEWHRLILGAIAFKIVVDEGAIIAEHGFDNWRRHRFGP